MRLRLVTWLAAILLLGGGVAFGFVGYRALRLEQEENEWRAAERARRALARAVADAERLARLPDGPPLEAWRIEPLTVPGAGETFQDEDLERLHAARERAVAQADRTKSYAIWDRLTREARANWLRQTAALHAGRLAAQLGRDEDAVRHLKVAADALPLLVAPKCGRVRAWALEQLAEHGLRTGRSEPTRAFLDAVEDGTRLTEGVFVGGPDTWLVVLQKQVAEGKVPSPDPETTKRLKAAATHAQNGMIHLIALQNAEAPVRLAGDRIVLRAGDRLQTRSLASLVEPPPEGFPSRVEVMRLDPADAPGLHMARLAAPLEAIVVRVAPEEHPSQGMAPLWVLIAGLSLYAVGAVLALVALRRSRLTAQMQTDFVAAVSHEMKTPIASVRAMAELLADADTPDPERARRYAGRIEGEMQRLGDTVRNVLDAAQIERLGALPVSLRPGDPAAVVEAAVEAVRPVLERRGFELTSEVRPAAAPLPIDSEALRGVLLNLLDNAAKYSVECKEVRVEAGPLRDANGYEIAVLDRGRGLESGKHEQLFRRFQRGVEARRDAVPGVGLGLHVARGVIDAHGGRLRAEPRDGGGAAFRIELRGTQT